MPNKRAAAMRVLSFALVTAAFPASTRGAVRLSADSATVESCSNLQRIYRPGKPLEEYPVLPIYEMRLLRDSSVHLLRRMLKSRCWAEARELYFTNYRHRSRIGSFTSMQKARYIKTFQRNPLPGRGCYVRPASNRGRMAPPRQTALSAASDFSTRSLSRTRTSHHHKILHRSHRPRRRARS
jgi:hypothetical protein